jgi:hypothetical protein
MPDANQTESPGRPRDGRRGDPEARSQSSSRPAPGEAIVRAEPQPAGAALQKEPSPSAEPDGAGRFERVRQRAYEIYVTRGRTEGDEVADWLEAERQVDSESPR